MWYFQCNASIAPNPVFQPFLSTDMSRRFTKKKWLMLPVEVAARELDAKMLLGCAAAQAGYNAVIGSIRAFSKVIPFLPRGVWVTGCIDRSKVEDFRWLKRHGFRVVCSDEEGFMQFSDEHYARNRLSEEGM